MTRTTLLFSAVVGLIAFTLGLTRRCDHRRCGWDLVPVVVASVDLPAGTRVTFDMLSQRSVPEQFVTSSVVKSDSASLIVGQVIENAVAAGDPLRWVDFPFVSMSRDLARDARAVRLPLDEAFVKGDRVDLWSNGLLVAENAEVLIASGNHRWVRVRAGEAEMLVRTDRGVTAVLRPR